MPLMKNHEMLNEMMEKQLKARGIRSSEILQAFAHVDRKKFVDRIWESEAYEDRPLSIGWGQTVSQPYIVAYMLEVLDIRPDHRILEIGTGSLYNAALMSELAAHVYSIEVVPALYERAVEKKAALGLDKISLRLGDGYEGWAEEAPFDAIILTAAPEHEVPAALFEQLKEGGKLIAPIGDYIQTLNLYEKQDGKIIEHPLKHVRFVPMVHH